MRAFQFVTILKAISRISFSGADFASTNGVPIGLQCDQFGNLWVSLSALSPPGGGVTPSGLIQEGDNADAVAVTTVGDLLTIARNTGFNGVTWDRLRSGADNSDAQVALALGCLESLARNYGWNGATWDRLASGADNADAIAAAALGRLLTSTRGFTFNGTTWDRARSASAANLAAQSGQGAALISKPGEWAINNTPAAATQATITKAAGAAGVRHVCTSVSFGFNAINVEAGTFLINLRDGATGAGTILQSWRVGPFAAGASVIHSKQDMNIPGTAATAMTMEFAGAPAAGNFEFVDMAGYDAS